MLKAINDLLFPKLCHRCYGKAKLYFCDSCMQGIDLGGIFKRNQAFLFASSMPSLLANNSLAKKTTTSFCIIQLERLSWKFGKIETCSSFHYLRKPLKIFITKDYGKSLYIIARDKAPVLKGRIRKNSYVLVI